MKFRPILAACFAGIAFSAAAQTDGVEYYKADQFGNAKELLLRTADKPGTDMAVTDYYLGLIALEEEKPAEARSYFEKGVQADAQNPYNYVGLAQIALLNGDTKGAEAQIKLAEKVAKKDASFQIAVARAYYGVDPVAYAKEIDKRIEKARKIDMKNADIYIFEGDALKDKKDWGGAAAKYEMAANYDNTATGAYVKYANLFTQVNPEYAVDMLNSLLALNPTSALGQREIANAYYNKKDFANAAQKYGEYVQNPAHFKQDEDRYAFLLFYGGDFQKGYDYATNLLKANPSNFTAQRYQFMNAAQLESMKDQLLPMAEALYAAHKANPANRFAAIDYNLISDEFKAAKRYDEAVNVLQEAIEQMPDQASFNKNLAFLYASMNQISNAADAYHGYLEKTDEPGYNDFVQQATFSYYAGVENKTADPAKSAKYFDDTLAFVQKASDILPTNYKPKKFVGDVAKQRATTDEQVKSVAAPAYLEAVTLLEAKPDARYAADAKEMYNYLGNYYLDQKDVAKAKEYFNKYLEYDPNNDAYRKFVEGLK
ncbi:MAG: tetratricopeptide repeat protein [Muribaculaceae bacterium]|nr:tetratricopeptide repeat protein [Muribaculaceae bacterium]